MSPLDRVIASVSPKWAARRQAARAQLQVLQAHGSDQQRKYEGAARGRQFDSWFVSNAAADVEVHRDGALLRARSRDLVRNNAHAARAVQVLVSNIVGLGINPSANSGDPDLDRRVDALWQRWSPHCDADGHTDFSGFLALAVREMVEGGEAFAIRRTMRTREARSRRVPLPLQVELREADHLDANRATYSEARGTELVRQGIIYNGGRRVGYWMFPDHPGDMLQVPRQSLQSQRVAAGDVAHLFERQRVQSRGVPWAAPVMANLRDLDDWQNAELVRKKIEACNVAVVTGFEDEDDRNIAPRVTDADGNEVEKFQPGLIAYARGGKDVKFNQPANAGGIYEWASVQLHTVAAGYRVPYELLTGDLRQVNFSSSRLGLNEFRRMISAVQRQIVIPQFCNPIWSWFIEAAWLAGELGDGPMPVVPAKWTPPAFESVNPKQDAETDLLNVRSGFQSWRSVVASRGETPEEMLQEIKAHRDRLEELGVVLDSDPAVSSRAGVAMSQPAASPAGDQISED